ncbi:MAG: DUF1643 domain-containing protein [Owenweeksia sp.]|nr:DUF1643 domain-containing protein [Owenweeksia sp.]
MPFHTWDFRNRPLYVIGLNPSTADDNHADQTIKRVMGFADRNGFDSFIMLNLYPKRTPYPDHLDNAFDRKLLQQNIAHIIKISKRTMNPSFLAAWGETIKVRDYFSTCLHELVKTTKNNRSRWLKIGELTKSGHPRHPSRAAYNFGLTDFDIEDYLTTLEKKK